RRGRFLSHRVELQQHSRVTDSALQRSRQLEDHRSRITTTDTRGRVCSPATRQRSLGAVDSFSRQLLLDLLRRSGFRNLHVEGSQRRGTVVEAAIDQGRKRLDRYVPVLG